MSSGRLRVVVVGFGPVGARLCEELLPAVRSGTVELTVIGAESDAPYNRVLIAELAAGRADRDALLLHDPADARAAGARVVLGTRVVALDRDARCAELETGERIPYDRVVLATGARANVPTLAGLDRPRYDEAALRRTGPAAIGSDALLPTGVTVLRDIADAERVHRAVRAGARITVLGAGVLGLEFALLAADAGAQVSVLHHGPTPMPRNLDRGAGTVLARALKDRGITVFAHSRAEAVAFRENGGSRAFDAVVTADGNYLRGDLLVLSCGIGARTELATLAGLRTAAGVVVDEQLRSWSDEAVYAIGDCAHVVPRTAENEALSRLPGAPSGLIGPGWRQAAWLAARLAAEAARIRHDDPAPIESDAVVMLKDDDIDVVAVGDVDIELWDQPLSETEPLRHVAQWADPMHGRYVKMVTHDGVLDAFACVGMPRTAAELTLLYDRRGELPSDRSLLLRLDGADEISSAADAFAPTATVCSCNGVRVQRIADSIAAGNDTVACLGRDTRAGTGCGGCKGRLVDLIERFAVAEAASA
ncbi:FAD-dependent oxidoreductase [Microbacterium sp. CIAB417]|uniref:FAD-dependent oxidoreductase n=1 Tax=Microbacterium sp. CIAB417 TaxID=2860287 RepID=UPI001FAD3908|nr:FAD-dependent oxidoreductase [Microbacterium sp. CIAB417]